MICAADLLSRPGLPASSAGLPTPHFDALRSLSHALARWTMRGLDDLSNPIIAALRGAGDALYVPYQDLDASESACEAALRTLVAEFVHVYTESDRLTTAEVEAVWVAQGYLDKLDEAAAMAAREEEARRCYAAAQRDRLRPVRNGQRRRREEQRQQAGQSAETDARQYEKTEMTS